jgi:hypothetical protein
MKVMKVVKVKYVLSSYLNTVNVYPLPGKGNYPRHLSGMLPGRLLHVLPANYQELPENSPKNTGWP